MDDDLDIVNNIVNIIMQELNYELLNDFRIRKRIGEKKKFKFQWYIDVLFLNVSECYGCLSYNIYVV